MSDAVMAKLVFFFIFFYEVAVKITGHNNRNIFITEIIIAAIVPYFLKSHLKSAVLQTTFDGTVLSCGNCISNVLQ